MCFWLGRRTRPRHRGERAGGRGGGGGGVTKHSLHGHKTKGFLHLLIKKEMGVNAAAPEPQCLFNEAP